VFTCTTVTCILLYLGEVWEAVEPPTGKTLKQISVGCCAVWGLDSAGQLSVRREVTPVFPEGTHWQMIPTSANDMGSHGEHKNQVLVLIAL
jgi:hypothetical protein